MSVRRIRIIAFLLLTFVITMTGHASAQEETPTATPTTAPEFPLTEIPDGTWLVGNEVTAGIYSAPGGAQCSWKRLSGFGGTSNDVIARAIGTVRPIVEIGPADRGFMTSNCGQWTLVELTQSPTLTPTLSPTQPPTMTAIPTLTSTTLPTPTSTAIPTPASTPVPAAKRLTGSLGSQGNPVPFGQTVKVEQWEITVVKTVADATKEVLNRSTWNDPPGEGNQFFMVTVKAKFRGSGSTRFDGSYRMRALGPSGVVYTTFENSCGVIPDKLADPELFKGGQIEGAVCWEIVSEDADSLVMILDPDAFSDGKRVWFSLHDTSSGGTEVEPEATAAPTPMVTIPRGWSPVVNTRLGYSLAVPRGWSIFDLQSGQLSKILRFVNPTSAQEVDELLDSPEAENAGHLAIELAIFSQPPIATLAGVGTVPLDDDIPAESVVKWLKRVIESFDMIPLEVQSLETGSTNNLPAIQGIVTADLSEQGLFYSHAVITALRANDTAYILVVVTSAKEAEAKQQQIDQIVGTFRPE